MSKLLTLTGTDFVEFDPCYIEDGGEMPEWSKSSGTMLDILRSPEIKAEDKVWAFTRDVRFVDDQALQDRILRLFACKCVRSTPLDNGRVARATALDAARDARDAANAALNARAARAAQVQFAIEIIEQELKETQP